MVGWEKVTVTQNTDSRTYIHDIEKLLKFNHDTANDTLKSGKSLEQPLHKSQLHG